MQTQGLTTRLEGQDPSTTNDVAGRSSRGSAAGRLALVALLVGGVAGAAAGLSYDRPATTQQPTRQFGPGTPSFAAAHAAKPTTERQVGAGTPNFAAALHAVKPATTAPQTAVQKPVRRSLMVLIPGDRDYVASSSIAVAGLAFGRPRSRIRAVEVELWVGDRLVDHVRLDVLSSRFAGVLKLSTPIGTADAELRISDPTHQSGPAVVRHLTIDPPAS